MGGRWTNLYWIQWERMTQKKTKKWQNKKNVFFFLYFMREFICFDVISNHHHHHDVAMAHSVWFENQWIFRFSHFKALCRWKRKKKKQKKVYFFDFIDLNPLYHIVGLNPFWFDISDCVLSVVAPFLLFAFWFSVHWTVVCGFMVFIDEDLGETDGVERVAGGWTAWIWHFVSSRHSMS